MKGLLTPSSNLEVLADLLKEDGYRVTSSTETLIHLKIDGGFYLIGAEQKDPDFYQIAFPGLYSAPGAALDPAIQTAMLAVTTDSKFVKCYAIDDTVFAVVHVLADSPKDLVRRLPRYVSALKFALSVFYGATQKDD